MRRLILASLSAGVALWSSDGRALDDAACCLQSTSRLDSLMNPVAGGDERFFTGKGARPNLAFFFPRPRRMLHFPYSLREIRTPGLITPTNNGKPTYVGSTMTAAQAAEGCGNSFLNGLEYFHPNPVSVNLAGAYSPTNVYPAPEWAYAASLAQTANGIPGQNVQYNIGGTRYRGTLFRPDSYYNFRDWSSRCENDGVCKPKDIDLACADGGAGGAGTLTHGACKACLTTKGYWLNPTVEAWKNQDTSGTFAGNWLNFYPPKFLMMRLAVKTVVRGASVDSMRIAVFTNEGGNGACEAEALHPPCTNLAAPDKNHVGNTITDLSFHISDENPIAEMLTNAGQYLAQYNQWTTLFADGSSSGKRTGCGSPCSASCVMDYNHDSDNNKPHCLDCQRHFFMLFSDGRGDEGNSDCNDANGDAVPDSAWCTTLSKCAVEGLGLENDGGDWIKDDPALGQARVTGITARVTPAGTCDRDYADDIAAFLQRTDLYPPTIDRNNVFTYTVGVGSGVGNGMTILKEMARRGGGKFAAGTSYRQMVRALQDLFDDVNSRNTAFSAASVASLQSGSASLTAVIPRMSPQRKRPWVGSLARFALFNEFVLNVEHPQDQPTEAPGTPGYLSDVFITDQGQVAGVDTDGNGTTDTYFGDIVVEDSDGNFIKRDSRAAAVPYWEARARLLGTRTWQDGAANSRSVWTLVDSNADGVLTDADAPLEFTTANGSRLGEYLGIRGTSLCPTGTAAGSEGEILQRLALLVADAAVLVGVSLPALTAPTQAQLDEVCVKVLIQYVRGRDLGDEDEDADRNEMRESAMGDIFHSSPVVVDPPVDKFLCDFGLHNQCARTLYATSLPVPHTPLKNDYTGADCPAGRATCDAYDAFHKANRERDKLILVGANDGMLHAFHNGDFDSQAAQYDAGTGDEVWAVIPPDLLARLHEGVGRHAYFVDGDIMVRDIWADTDNNAIKQKEEFHTLAIASEGRGGTHYVALEMKFDASGNAQPPGFRWIYPQPCTPSASIFGKTLFALAPKAPPIGPVLLDAQSAGLTGVANRYGTTAERWVAMLSGGWSPTHERGRVVAMVDAWEGIIQTATRTATDRKDNLWWQFGFVKGASGDQREPLRFLTYGIVAPVAMIDYGANDNVRLDGFFDTGVVGDLGGQVWVLRYAQPGVVDATSKLVTNWSAARGFEQDRAGIQAGMGVDEDLETAADPLSVRKRWPFYYIASAGLQPDNNALRVMLGTGNRYSILDNEAGICRFDNPLACAKYGCNEHKAVYRIAKTTADITKMETHWEEYAFKHGKLDLSAATRSACGTPPASSVDVVVDATFADHKLNGCPGNINYGQIRQFDVDCGQDSNGQFACRRVDTTTPNLADLSCDLDAQAANKCEAGQFTYTAASLSTIGKNRFYGIWIYGGHPDRKFEEWRTTGAPSARSFDGLRLSDRTSGNGTQGDLVDTTPVTCSINGACVDGGGSPTFGATATNWGWFLEYLNFPTDANADVDHAKSLSHKTASGAALLASCVLWSSLFPSSANVGCGSARGVRSRFYQRDFLSGLPNCAAGFKGECEDPNAAAGSCSTQWAGYQERSVVAPPPEPATVVMISRTGQIKYSALIVEPGKPPEDKDVTQSTESLQAVYELPVSRGLHMCRHVSGSACATLPP